MFELGLDPTQFKKGSRETEKQLASTGKKVRDVSDSMGKSIANMARQFAVAFLGFKGVQGLIGLNHASAQLGVLSKNTGVATEQLNALGEALRINTGGAAESAFAALSKITEEQTNLRNSLGSTWLPDLARLNVGLTDAGMNAREPLQVLLDFADAFKRIAATRGEADAFNIASSMGFDKDTVNFLKQGRAAIEAQIAAQLRQKRLTAGEAGSAKKTEQAIDALRIRAEHVFQDLLNKLRPFIIEFTDWLGKISADPTVIAGTADALTALAKGIQFFVDVIKLAVRGWSEIMNTEVGKFMSKLIGTGAEKFHEFVNAGDEDKALTPGYGLRGLPLLQVPGYDGGYDPNAPAPVVAPDRSWPDRLRDYNARERARLDAQDQQVQAYKDSQAGGLSAQRAAQQSAQVGGSVTNMVRIDNMQINAPQATDAPGIARNMVDAIKSKARFVDQANTGMR